MPYQPVYIINDISYANQQLHARVAFWLRPKAFSLKDIKMECKSQNVPVTGNKKVLALKLAFKNLPADIESSTKDGYTITQSSPNKQGGKRVKMSKQVRDDRANETSADENVANGSSKKQKTAKTLVNL